jgi:hypothetical protein
MISSIKTMEIEMRKVSRNLWRVVRSLAVERKARVGLAVIIASILGYAALALSARAYAGHTATAITEPEGTALEAALPASPIPRDAPVQSPPFIDGFLVTLHPQGFQPDAITRKQGRLAVIVINKSGLNDVSVNLEREVGGRLLATPISREKPVWGDAIELAPGRYVLTEASHPKWVCNITVTAR